ncbi:MAG: hypothetical protein PHZ26_04365 [Candidatus Gracilibacteria bacterium]|nr:hypothetical protein [Candidatus Gracilibacteria bacterium]MDD2908962.1 hypothetical protein [Candidatus Gracilibacteria bacterium]
MKIVIYGENENSTKLYDLTQEVLEGIGLNDFVVLEKNVTEEYKNNLSIKSDYAFCIEEESIDFKDIIFEGQIPSKEEINSLLISLIGGESSGGCPSDGCSSCGGGC